MKKLILLAFALFLAVAVQAQAVKEVVFKTEPEIECNNCVKRIKDNIRFVKGVKSISPDLKTKLVTIQYDSEKATLDDFVKAFAKIGYKVTVVEPKKEQTVEAADNPSEEK